MKCPRCQQDNPNHARFCLGCGARLALACGSCGAELPVGARFCLQCGQAVAAGTAAPVRSPAPETYTPKHLAEKILTSRSALEGERKQVTVLFADLKGSMELLADRDPEQARRLLDPVLEHMMEAIHCFEGTVNQVMGDGIMALFGAPLAQEDHAVRACYAALRMQDTMKRYAEGIFRSHGVPVEIRVGLNSGEVVVRAIGSDLRMDYTAVGQTTHLAARMEQLARPGTILLTSDTLALAEGFVQVESRGPVPVKGLPDPIELYELTGASPVRSRFHAATARGLTPFVGRDTELELLRRTLERAGAGQGQVIAVVGEPGVGKSRLAWEFSHSHRTRDWLVLEAASTSYGKTTTYFPVIELLKAYFQIEPRDDARKIREKVTGKLLSLDRTFEPTLPVFLALLDVPIDDPEWARLDPALRRHRTFDAIKRLLLRESQVQPVLLVFEDLHWIDGETQSLLDSLVESLPTACLLLLVNYRPEYTHGWGNKTYYQQLRLDTLPPARARDLLEGLLGGDPTLGDLKRLLIEHTQGNPFFLEESVRALVETKALVGQRGAYQLSGPLQGLQLPATAQAILAARIDRLGPEDKRLLQAASVIGKDVPLRLLQAIADEGEEVIRQQLARLQAAEFLYEAQLFPDLEYTFRHALTHDVAYASVLHERRRTLHARIVESIERLYSDRLVEHVEQLARHALLAEQWEKAVDYLRRAGAKAAARSAHREAASHFEQGLTALSHLAETDESCRLAIDLRFDLRNSLMPLGDAPRMLRHLTDAEILAERLGDRRRLGQVCAFLTNAHIAIGNHDHALRSARRALELADQLGDFALRVLANFRLGQANFPLGRYAEAIDHFGRAAADLPAERMRERLGMAGFPAALSRSLLALPLAETGDFAAAKAVAEKGLQMAEAAEQPFTLTIGLAGLAHLWVRQGDLGKAIPLLERGLAIARERDVPVLSFLMASHLSYAYAVSGQSEQAHPWLEQAIGQAAVEKFEFFRTMAIAILGEACLLLGRTDDAERLASRALDVARTRNELGDQAWLLRLLGRIASDRDPPELAQTQTHYRAALDLASRLGMRPLVAHCHLGLGKLYRRVGKRQEAKEHLTTAATMYREMEMRFWLEQAETEMNELG